MRTDENLARRSFRFSEEWERKAGDAPLTPQIDRRLRGGRREDGKYVVHSLSGGERNHYFANRRGASFEDLSALSGLDNPADGRGFVLLDYDRDGWQDLALVNANEPLFNLYHNELGALERHAGNGVVALRFVGGATAIPEPGHGLACRDGYGALVTADLGDLKLEREHRCGEGFSVQNSATMVLGIGARKEVPSLTVRWPSGRSMTTENVPAGTLLTVYEQPPGEARGAHFKRTAYHVTAPSPRRSPPRAPVRFPVAPDGLPDGIRVFTTTATWCAACKAGLVQLEAVKDALEGEPIHFLGIPVDPDDDAGKLAAYLEDFDPPYRLLTELSPAERPAVDAFIEEQTGRPAVLPSTIVTAADGTLLEIIRGVPSVSAIRRIAARRSAP